MPLRPDYTFRRFTPTPGTRRAVGACRALVGSASARLLTLVGPPGTGKTHLLHAVGHAITSKRTSGAAVYVPVRTLCDEIVEAIRHDGHSAAVPHGYRRFSVVLLDDVQELAGKPATQSELSRLIGDCLRSGGRVLCAATRWPFDPEMSGAAWTRARVVRLVPPTAEGMRRILGRVLANEQLRPDVGTMRLFARESEGDVRRALGALAVWRFRLRAADAVGRA